MAAPNINSSSPVTYFSNSPSGIQEIDALVDDVKWGNAGIGTSATVYYSFPTSSSNILWSNLYQIDISSEIYTNFQPLSTSQKNAAQTVLQSWENVADIDLIAVLNESNGSVGDIRIANTNIADANTYAYAYLPASGNPIGGDIWFNNIQPNVGGSNFSIGANGYHTMLHETGHALGLTHPFSGSTTLNTFLDSHKYTVMSYSTVAFFNGGNSSYYPTTPMLLDIQAIQYLYGANTSYNAGNNTYTFSDAQTYYETIWDAGGEDTIQYTGSSDGQINLNAGTFSQLGQSITLGNGSVQLDNVAIAYNVVIENVISGAGNDIITGNSSSNNIDGGDGADTFITTINQSEITSVSLSSQGNIIVRSVGQVDTLTNIESFQFLDGSKLTIAALSALSGAPLTFTSNVNGNSIEITATVYSGPVTYLEYVLLGNSSNEIITGANSNDFINLLGGDDAANGGAGDDVLDGGLGSNFLTGGAGKDTFFLDGRGSTTTWSTVTDFTLGTDSNDDNANIWGYQNGISILLLTEENGGTTGFEGATYHYDLNGDNTIDTSITFSGLSTNEASQPTINTVGDNTYLLFS